MKQLLVILALLPLQSMAQLKSVSFSSEELNIELQGNPNQPDYNKSICTFLNLNNSECRPVQRLNYIEDDGTVHLTFQQYVQNVPVEHSLIRLQLRESKIYYLNGSYVDDDLSFVDTTVSDSAAFTAATEKLDAKDFVWDNVDEMARVTAMSDGSTMLPSRVPMKVFLGVGGKTILAYKFHILTLSPYRDEFIYVDCGTGYFLTERSLVRDAAGTANTRYSGTQTINTRPPYSGSPYYGLHNEASTDIPVANMVIITDMDGACTVGINEVNDGDNSWTDWPYTTLPSSAIPNLQAALDHHYGAEMTYKYFRGTHGYSSLNGLNDYLGALRGSVRLRCDATFLGASATPDVGSTYTGVFQANAFYMPSHRYTIYGDGGKMLSGHATGPFVSLDIVGHEYGHGIYHNLVGLSGGGDAEGLDEGLSDVWGACIEKSSPVTGNSTWLLGERVMLPAGTYPKDNASGYYTSYVNGTAIRSMSNPKDTDPGIAYPGASCFWGDNYGEVHQIGGVMGYWFYLLSQGGSGTVDGYTGTPDPVIDYNTGLPTGAARGETFNLTGITMAKAAKIVFRAERHLTPASGYPEMCALTLQAAKDLYGDCSPELINTIKAWHAVGVHSKFGGSNVAHMGSGVIIANYFSGSITTTVKYLPGSKVEDKARRYVLMQPGFMAVSSSGSRYLARIADCGAPRAGGNTGDEDQQENDGGGKIVSVTRTDLIKVYPNPVTNKLSVSYGAQRSGALEVSIRDVTGRTRTIASFDDEKGANAPDVIDMSAYEPGIYIVDVTVNNEHTTTKVVKL